MNRTKLTRRDFLTNAATRGLAACALPVLAADTATEAPADQAAAGSQRLPLGQLRKWEALQYGGKRGQEPFPTRSRAWRLWQEKVPDPFCPKAIYPGREAVLICHLGREVLKAAIISGSGQPVDPLEVWTEQRRNLAFELLGSAVQATVGSDYEENCADRPQRFQSALERLVNLNRACSAIQAREPMNA